MTLRDSMAENIRRPIRYDRWVCNTCTRPSSKRCEASSRWTPSERPSRPIIMNRSANSGLVVNSSPNSSTMTTSVCIAASWTPVARARSYSWIDVYPCRRSSSCRRTISPCNESCMRSTRCSSSSRLVISAETCGSPSSPRNVAPPLKSISTMLSFSDEWVSASASTMVRIVSLLPEPVAPIMMPCGPMPPCADSLRSSSSVWPVAVRPIGIRRWSQAVLARHRSFGSMARRSAMPSSEPRSAAMDVDSALTLVELAAAEQPFQLVPLVADQPLGARRVVLLRVLGVRQPLDVVPVAQPVPAGADRDPQVLVRVERGQLRDDRPGGRPGEVDRTLQQDPREPAQVHRDRHVLDQAVRAQEPAQRAGAQRFEVGHRLGLRCLYLQRQPLLP